jgi:hypothetical protein
MTSGGHASAQKLGFPVKNSTAAAQKRSSKTAPPMMWLRLKEKRGLKTVPLSA